MYILTLLMSPLFVLFNAVAGLLDAARRGIVAGLELQNPLRSFLQWHRNISVAAGNVQANVVEGRRLARSIGPGGERLAPPLLTTMFVTAVANVIMRVVFSLVYPLCYLAGLVLGILLRPIDLLFTRRSS